MYNERNKVEAYQQDVKKNAIGGLQQTAQYNQTTERKGDVAEGLQDLEHWIVETETAFIVLRDKLNVLVKPLPKGVVGDNQKQPEPCLSPLATELQKQSKRLKQLCLNVIELKDLIEL